MNDDATRHLQFSMHTLAMGPLFVWQGLNQFVQDVVGLFAILNPLGNLPIFLGLTREATVAQRRRMFRLATITGSAIVAIGVHFIFSSIRAVFLHQ